MKKMSNGLGVLMAVVLLVAVIGAAPVFADCPDQHYDCYTKDNHVKVGSDYVRQCWKWGCQGGCQPCYCDGSCTFCNGGYQAGWCNADVPACNGNCCACLPNSKCYDKDGNYCFSN